MSKALGGRLKLPNIRAIERDLKRDMRLDVASRIQARMEEITSPFETGFEFETIEKESNGNLLLSVVPKRESISRTTGGEVDSWVLFNTLDLGSTNAARVVLPDDFSNETFPNSLVTRGANYDRNQIVVLHNQPFDQEMEPRYWSRNLREEYELTRFGYIRTLVGKATRRALGI